MSESISVPTGYGNVTSVSVNLTITNAYREDTGVYTCSANNSIGSDNKNVIITVQCKSILLSATFTLKTNNLPTLYSNKAVSRPGCVTYLHMYLYIFSYLVI